MGEEGEEGRRGGGEEGEEGEEGRRGEGEEGEEGRRDRRGRRGRREGEKGGGVMYIYMTYNNTKLMEMCKQLKRSTHPVWARTWLWRARNETLLSMASRDLAHSRAT